MAANRGRVLGASLCSHMQVLLLQVWHKPLTPLATQSALWAGLALFALDGDRCQWLVGFVRFVLNICQWPLSGVARVAGERLHLIGWATVFHNQSKCCAWGRGTQHDRAVSSTGRHILGTNKASGKMELWCAGVPCPSTAPAMAWLLFKMSQPKLKSFPLIGGYQDFKTGQ